MSKLTTALLMTIDVGENKWSGDKDSKINRLDIFSAAVLLILCCG